MLRISLKEDKSLIAFSEKLLKDFPKHSPLDALGLVHVGDPQVDGPAR